MPKTAKQSGIYCIRNTLNGRVYVGSAINIKGRWHSHRNLLNSNKHHSAILNRSWQKHGPEVFVFEVIETVLNKQDLIRREQHWIDALQAANPSKGFNMSPFAGSPLGFRHSIETRLKHSSARRGRKRAPFTAEHKENIRLACIGRKARSGFKLSESRKQKLRELHTGKAMNISPEVREQMAQRCRDRNVSDTMREKVRAAKVAFYATSEGKARLSEKGLKQWARRREEGRAYGTKHTEETKRLLSVAKKGKMSQAHKDAIVLSNKRRAKKSPYHTLMNVEKQPFTTIHG